MNARKTLSIAAAALAVGGVAAGSVAYADGGDNVTVVNSKTDPAQADELMQVFQTIRAQKPQDTSYTPTSDPTTGLSGWSDAGNGDVIANCGGDKTSTSKTLTVTHGTGFTSSLGASVSIGSGFEIPEITSLSVTVKLGVEHEWSSENENSQGVKATATGNTVVMVLTAQHQVTVTGSYQFTTPGGDYQVVDQNGNKVSKHVNAGTYSIQNVTVNMLAAAKSTDAKTNQSSDDPNTGIVYLAVQTNNNTCAKATAGGKAPKNGIIHDPAAIARVLASMPKRK